MTEISERPGDTPVRMGRRTILGGLAASGTLVAVSRLTGASAAATLQRILGVTPAGGGSVAGSFTATFDFVSGVVDVVGDTVFGAGVHVDVTVEAFLNGAPMPPGGSAAVRSVTVQTAADGSFAASPSFGGATNDNANQFRVTITTGSPTDDDVCLSGAILTPEPPLGPPGPAGPEGGPGAPGAPGPAGPVPCWSTSPRMRSRL